MEQYDPARSKERHRKLSEIFAATFELEGTAREEALGLCGSGPDAPRLIDVDRAEAGGDQASTVIDCASPEPSVLRWGAVEVPELGPVLEDLSGA